MFADEIIARSIDRLHAAGELRHLDNQLVRYSVDDARVMTAQLLPAYDEKTQRWRRPRSPEEARFIANEQLLCGIDVRYWLERYCYIRREGNRLAPLAPLWASQVHILDALARLQAQRHRDQHPDGCLIDILKARQLGASTMTQAIIAHRAIFYPHTFGLIAANVPLQSVYLFSMLELTLAYTPAWMRSAELAHPAAGPLRLANGSVVSVESGQTMTGTEMEEGQGRRGQLGVGRTYGCAHLSEIPLWPYPEMMDSSLLPAIPRARRTFCVREATAQGRNNYWHVQWQLDVRDQTRFMPVFIPWFIEPEKYWLPPKDGWTPSSETLAYVQRAEAHAPRWLFGRSVKLTKEQICWYETERAAAEARDAYEPGSLAYFLANYPAEPEESFQHTGRSVFGPLLLERLKAASRQLRPEGIATVVEVQPRADLAALKHAVGGR